MYKLLYRSLALGSGQRLLYRLGSGLGLVLVLVLRFCMCPADFCDSGPESLSTSLPGYLNSKITFLITNANIEKLKNAKVLPEPQVPIGRR